MMPDIHPINQSLLTVLENQVARTVAAFEAMDDSLFSAAPGRDCNSIRQIGEHLLYLRRFQLKLLESPLAGQVADQHSVVSVADLVAKLAPAAQLVAHAITEHDEQDWYRRPKTPRPAPWGDDPTIIRFTRPLNDFTNHLGAIRAIRRMLGDPAPQTQ